MAEYCDSFYIIKPDGMSENNRRFIFKKFDEVGLEYKREFEFVFNEELLHFMYKNLVNRKHKYLVKNYMLPRKDYPAVCEFGYIYGFNALERLINIVGDKTYSFDCDVGTIRNVLGKTEIIDVKKGLVDIRNVVHRPVSKFEKELFLVQFLNNLSESERKPITSISN